MRSALRRAVNLAIDLIDGVLAAVLYSRQGLLPSTLPDLEHLNESKLRTWSAGSAAHDTGAPADATDDMKIEARIAAFRARTKAVTK